MNKKLTPLDRLIPEARAAGGERISAGAEVMLDGKFLLLERVGGDTFGGLVELPGGALEPGEDLLTGALRELKEETGLEAANEPTYLDYFDYLSGSGKESRQFVFLVKAKPGRVKLNPSEHGAYFLIDPKEVATTALNLSKEARSLLLKNQNMITSKQKTRTLKGSKRSISKP